MERDENKQLTLYARAGSLVVQEKLEFISELLRYLQEVEKKLDEIREKLQGHDNRTLFHASIRETYDEGEYINEFGSLLGGYTAILHAFGDAMLPQTPQSIFRKGHKKAKRHYLGDLLRGISRDLGFHNFIPDWWSIYSQIKINLTGQEKEVYEKACAILPDRYADIENPLTEEEWQILRELCYIHVYDQVLIALHEDTINVYMSNIRLGSSVKWPSLGKNGKKILQHLERFDTYQQLIGAYTPRFDKTRSLEEEIARIIQGEEARFRLFTDAFYTTLTAMTALSQQEQIYTPQQTPDVQAAITTLAHMVKQAQKEQKEQLRKQQEAHSKNEGVVETEVYTSQASTPITSYEEETAIEDEEVAATEPQEKQGTAEPTVAIKPTHTWLGKCIYAKDIEAGKFIEINDKTREEGIYIVGRQGVGKSTILENLIYQDLVKGHSMIVIDPHV